MHPFLFHLKKGYFYVILLHRYDNKNILVKSFSITNKEEHCGKLGGWDRSSLFTGWFFGQTAWEASLQEEVWRTFLDKQ
jgi:hypothetical protein